MGLKKRLNQSKILEQEHRNRISFDSNDVLFIWQEGYQILKFAVMLYSTNIESTPWGIITQT